MLGRSCEAVSLSESGTFFETRGSCRGLPGQGPKNLKASNSELGSVCNCFLIETKRKHGLLWGVRGPPPEIFWILGSQMMHSSVILGHCTAIPLPPPPQKYFLIRFELISRMVQMSSKKPESLKSLKKAEPWDVTSLDICGLNQQNNIFQFYHC